MYRYYVNLNINNQRMYNEDLIFSIDIDSDITYEFLDCYVEFVKEYNGIENEEIIIEYYSDSNNIYEAKCKINSTLHFLSYLTRIPICDNVQINIDKTIDSMNKIIDESNKTTNLKYLNNVISKLDNKKPFFYHNIELISRAHKEKDIDGLWADAYINYFKVIENIASNKPKINYNSYEWNNKVKDIIMQNYGISYPKKKLKYISKKISELITDDVFFKIAILCKKFKIDIDSELIYKIITLRNDIVHGNDVKDYEIISLCPYVAIIANDFVSHSFFNIDYENIGINSSVHLS